MNRIINLLLVAQCWQIIAVCHANSGRNTPITLASSQIAHEYTGHGGLSAGASSRLLQDYATEQREEILDFLFLPGFGMNLHIIKLEIPSSDQSTDGTEYSHSLFPGDLSCDRGYELYLATEALKRNPNIKIYGLPWGFPAYIEPFSADEINYKIQFMNCLKQVTNGTKVIDYLGAWNERYWGGTDYIVNLRNALDSNGYQTTQLVIPDGGYDEDLANAALTNSTFNNSFYAIGLHYPCPNEVNPYPSPTPDELNKVIWASEDWWESPNWSGAMDWGRILSRHYVIGNMTSVIAWSPLWSVYPNLPFQEAGLMKAATPWSGTYDISPSIWTGAQFMQFTHPGWHFLGVNQGGSGWLPGNGTYVTLIDPNAPQNNFTLILETFANGNRCPSSRPIAPVQTVTFLLTDGLPTAGQALVMWLTNSTDFFIQLPDIIIANDNTITVTLPVDHMVTISTVRTASKGQPKVPIPPWSPFPFPYYDSFTMDPNAVPPYRNISRAGGRDGAYQYDDLGRFFADQFGSFAVRNNSLMQVAVGNSINGEWVTDADPSTIIGDLNWTDISVGITARYISPNMTTNLVSLNRLRDGAAVQLVSCDASSSFQVWKWNVTGPGYLSNDPFPSFSNFSSSSPVASNYQQCLNVYGCGHEMVYWSCITTGGTCCGGNCYKNLQWTLDGSTGALSTWLVQGGCVSADGTGNNITLANCITPVPLSQTWKYDTYTGLVKHMGSGLCLSQPPPPTPRSYVQVCARAGNGEGWGEKLSTPNAYCLVAGSSEDGTVPNTWTITNGQDSQGNALILANGTLASNFNGSDWHTYNISVKNTTITAYVDNVEITGNGIVDTTNKYPFGMVIIGSGYHSAWFDDFYVGNPITWE